MSPNGRSACFASKQSFTQIINAARYVLPSHTVRMADWPQAKSPLADTKISDEGWGLLLAPRRDRIIGGGGIARPAPGSGISEKGAEKLIVQRMPRTIAHEAGAERRAGQGQVPHHIQQFVADKFIGMAKPAGVQNGGAVHHHGIIQATAQGQAGLTQPLHLLSQGEGA